MVSQLWIDMFSGLSVQLGLTPQATIVLFLIPINLLLMLFFLISAEKHIYIDRGSFCVVTFFFLILLEVFMGAFDWYVIFLSLFIVGAYFFYMGSGENE